MPDGIIMRVDWSKLNRKRVSLSWKMQKKF